MTLSEMPTSTALPTSQHLSFFGSLYCSDTVSFAVTQLEGAVVAIFLTYKHNRIKWALARFFTSCTL